MRVVVDRGVCQGIGMCESFAPDVFEVGDDGQVEVHESAVAGTDRSLLQQAVDGCPTLALTLLDD